MNVQIRSPKKLEAIRNAQAEIKFINNLIEFPLYDMDVRGVTHEIPYAVSRVTLKNWAQAMTDLVEALQEAPSHDPMQSSVESRDPMKGFDLG